MKQVAIGTIASLCFSASLIAQTITVDLARDDFTDFGGAQTVADLPGPDGHVTLREAIYAVNNTPGPQTIAFAIPTSEWSIFYTDRALIRLENLLIVTDDDTTIDFSTQAAFTGDTNPNGGEVGLQYAGVPAAIPSLWLDADRCTIRGLDVGIGNNFSNTIWISGNHNRVVGCTTNGLMIRGDYGGGRFNTVGGAAPGEGNTFSEWVNILSNADDNVMVGNYFRWGVRISGDTFWGTCDNNRIGGSSAAERNTLAGRGYYGEEGFPTGTQLEVYHAVNTVIQGNYVGTTPSGMSRPSGFSGTTGIGLGTGAVGTQILDNLVAGILMIGSNHYQGQRFGNGIVVVASAQNTTIQGNSLGLAADGATPIPNRQGILVQSDPNGIPQNVLIGGGDEADRNTIAHNETTGVRVSNSATQVRISRNSIRDNDGLGIDLTGFAAAGVTPNDALDLDTGGNGLQNYPVLAAAEVSAGLTRVVGTFHSSANSTFELEFFVSPSCDPSGFGEGAAWIGAATVASDAAGDATIDVLLPIAVAAGAAVTATATDAVGNTSEFSACVAATATTAQSGDMNCDGVVSVGDISPFVKALTDAAGYATEYPNCDIMTGDINVDGVVSVGDIGAFVALLTAAGA